MNSAEGGGRGHNHVWKTRKSSCQSERKQERRKRSGEIISVWVPGVCAWALAVYTDIRASRWNSAFMKHARKMPPFFTSHLFQHFQISCYARVECVLLHRFTDENLQFVWKTHTKKGATENQLASIWAICAVFRNGHSFGCSGKKKKGAEAKRDERGGERLGVIAVQSCGSCSLTPLLS